MFSYKASHLIHRELAKLPPTMANKHCEMSLRCFLNEYTAYLIYPSEQHF